MHFARILVPTDFSTSAASAIEVAVALAAQVGGSIDLVHVFNPPALMLPDGSTFVASPMALCQASEHADVAMAEATRAIEKIVGGRVRVGGYTRIGPAVDEIVRLASSGEYDVVVMGTHGRTGVGRLLLGSVAEGVMRRSPIPVITTRQPASPSARVDVAPPASPA
ncbi:MAG: UspA domain protein [Myxococcales bacterium]|nr:UspA domain protein [Myxococcales bacterium]